MGYVPAHSSLLRAQGVSGTGRGSELDHGCAAGRGCSCRTHLFLKPAATNGPKECCGCPFVVPYESSLVRHAAAADTSGTLVAGPTLQPGTTMANSVSKVDGMSVRSLMFVGLLFLAAVAGQSLEGRLIPSCDMYSREGTRSDCLLLGFSWGASHILCLTGLLLTKRQSAPHTSRA